MFIKIPFESIIEFKTNISEITKMSLEHDYNVNEGAVLGNFYISGEYQIHAISVNRDPFKYTLPFTVELRDDIKKDTLEFNIEDFSYEVIDNSKLKVNIEYSLQAEVEEKDKLFERVNEDELESELAYIDEFLEEINEPAEKIELVDKEEMQENKEENIEKEIEEHGEESSKEEVVEDRISKEEEKTIMDTIKDSDDTFVTYHIHIMKESETIESICSLYNVSNNLISEYNTTDNISVGDKILIPKIDE